MSNKNEFQIIKRKFTLVDYVYYLQYREEIEDIMVETADANFFVWEGSSFKVNGDEFSTKEFYEMLDKCQGPVKCNEIVFVKRGDVYESVSEIEVKERIISTIVKF